MNILRPNGMVERLDEPPRRSAGPPRYGRDKDGSPKDARSLKIANGNDRRRRDRRHDDPLRGRLLDLNA
ncbi:MAG: hypothetical protein HC871_08255 [Rhizobiales bacterium]|nr:hypothetical protein [Hyphomicrobiales bacterium]